MLRKVFVVNATLIQGGEASLQEVTRFGSLEEAEKFIKDEMVSSKKWNGFYRPFITEGYGE